MFDCEPQRFLGEYVFLKAQVLGAPESRDSAKMPQRGNNMISVTLGSTAAHLLTRKAAQRTTRRVVALGAVTLFLATGSSIAAEPRMAAAAGGKACATESTGITLPPGFCATVFADNVGHACHIVVAPDGVVYVNIWSGTYYGNDKPPAGGFLVALRDTRGSGRADVIDRFGPGIGSANAGGTGIALHNGGLYAETNDRIVRYALPAGRIAPATTPEVILSGKSKSRPIGPDDGQQMMRSRLPDRRTGLDTSNSESAGESGMRTVSLNEQAAGPG